MKYPNFTYSLADANLEYVWVITVGGLKELLLWNRRYTE